MSETMHLTFNDSPSALFTLWQAFRNRNSAFTVKEKVPVIHVEKKGFAISEKHLRAFHEICGIAAAPRLHVLYPFTLAYPYMMTILCRKEIPLSMFRMLNTRNSITMRRDIRPDEVLDIRCRNSVPRTVQKGLEVDIISEITAGGGIVWENITTYYVRGKYGQAENGHTPPKLGPAENAAVIGEWFLPAKDRFRFARVSGDTNGIHYVSWYARLMGFERDFAQPIRVAARCVSSLPGPVMKTPVKFDFFLKGPAYYERTYVLKNQKIKEGDRFDLYIAGSDKPCISGKVRMA